MRILGDDDVALDLELRELLLKEADVAVVRFSDGACNGRLLTSQFFPVRIERLLPRAHIHPDRVTAGLELRKLVNHLLGFIVKRHSPGTVHVGLQCCLGRVESLFLGLALGLEKFSDGT